MEQVGQRAPRQEWDLRAGADIEDFIGIDPSETAMGFQRGVLHPLRRERTLIGDRGVRQRSRDVAEFAMDFGHDIATCVRDAVFGSFLSPCSTGASGAIAATGLITAGRISY